MTEARRGSDPTEMRNQSAFWTSSGRTWLVTGGVALALLVGLFAWLATIEPTISLGTIIALVSLYVCMVAVRFAIRPRHARLVALFVLLLAMVATGLVGVWLVAGAG